MGERLRLWAGGFSLCDWGKGFSTSEFSFCTRKKGERRIEIGERNVEKKKEGK